MAIWAPVGFQVEVGRLRWEMFQLALGHAVLISEDFNGFSGIQAGGLGLGLHFPITAVEGLEFGFVAWPGAGETSSSGFVDEIQDEFQATFEPARMQWTIPINFYLRLSRPTHHFELGLWIPAIWHFDGSDTQFVGNTARDEPDPDDLGEHGGPPPIGIYLGGGI